MPKVKVMVLIEDWQREAAKIAKLNLSAILRQGIDAAINGNDEIEKQEAELENEKAKLRLKEMLITERKKKKQEQETQNKKRTEAMKWIRENPNYLKAYKEGKNMNNRVWQNIISGMNARNRNEAKKMFDEYDRDWERARS